MLNTMSAPLAVIFSTVSRYAVWSSGKYSSPTTRPPFASTTALTSVSLICSARDLGPVTPMIQSSAYLMYLTLTKSGSNVSIDGRDRICFVRARISGVMIPSDRFNARCLR